MKKSPNPYTFIQVKRLSYDPIHRMNFYSSGITHKREIIPFFHSGCKNTKKLNIVKGFLPIGIAIAKFCFRIDAV